MNYEIRQTDVRHLEEHCPAMSWDWPAIKEIERQEALAARLARRERARQRREERKQFLAEAVVVFVFLVIAWACTWALFPPVE